MNPIFSLVVKSSATDHIAIVRRRYLVPFVLFCYTVIREILFSWCCTAKDFEHLVGISKLPTANARFFVVA
jgi:hypothetical protein